MVKVYASEMLGRVADRAVQVFGGMGYCKDLAVERFYRDARIFRIFDGTSEIHRTVIARSMIKHGAARFADVSEGNEMAINKFVTAQDAASLIRDGDTVALIGGGGGLVRGDAACTRRSSSASSKRSIRAASP